MPKTIISGDGGRDEDSRRLPLRSLPQMPETSMLLVLLYSWLITTGSAACVMVVVMSVQRVLHGPAPALLGRAVVRPIGGPLVLAPTLAGGEQRYLRTAS
jgi:hypothetical protein